MNNFKSGSGDLDFGGDDEEEEEKSTDKSTQGESAEHTESELPEESASNALDQPLSDTGSASNQPKPDRASKTGSKVADSGAETYPYFVRRNNVGDEREKRLEIHVRDKVADQEAEFRNELAQHLDVSEVSKTDAREFALLVAFHNPERVAELMREEGFGMFG